MGLRAGLLTERITLLDLEHVKNTYGEDKSYWVDGETLRARVQFRSGSRGEENAEVWNPTMVTFLLRVHTPVTDKMRIKWQGRQYHVVSVNMEPRLQQQTVVAELVNE